MSVATGESRVFRGSSLEAVLAQVREALGEDAVVVRQREGVVGGIGGFFAKKCIEVEAIPGWPVADEETVLALPPREAMSHYGADGDRHRDERLAPPANDFMEALLDRAAAFDELYVQTDPVGLLPVPGAPAPPEEPTPGVRDFERLIEQAVAADARYELEEAAREADRGEPVAFTTDAPVAAAAAPAPASPPATASAPATTSAPAPERDPRDEILETEAGVRTTLAATGMSGAAIELVMDRVRMHLHPLAPTATARELARLVVRSALPAPVGWDGRRVIAFAGLDAAPVARAVAAIAVAQAATGMRVAVIALGGGRPAARLAAHLVDSDVDVLLARDLRDVEPALADAASADLVLAVSASVASDDDATGAACAAPLVALDPDEVHLVVPAGARPDRLHRALELLDGYLPVDCLLPCGAAVSDDLGVAVGVALERRLALRWVASVGTSCRVHPADPVVLAEAVLP